MPDSSQPRKQPSGSSSSRSRSRNRRRRSGGARSGTGARPDSAGRGRPDRAPASSSRRTITAAARSHTAADELAEAILAAPEPADRSASGAADDLSRVVAANRRRAASIALAPASVLLLVAIVVGGALSALVAGMVAGAVAAAVCGAGLWRASPRLVLRALGARLVDEDEVPGPFTQVEGLCATMGLPVPALYLVDEPFPDAMALGRGSKDGAVVLTSGLLRALDPVALEGVLAHELAHLKRADTAPASVAAALVLWSGLPSTTGTAVHRLAGRGREFEADRHAVAVTRYPPGLRHALDRMCQAVPSGSGPGGGLAGQRAGRVTRWLFTVPLPVPGGEGSGAEDPTGELDAPSVRIAALDEW